VIGQPVLQEFNSIRGNVLSDRFFLMPTKFLSYAIPGEVIGLPVALKEIRQLLSNKGQTTAGRR
jgi:hypothetical protein